MFFKKNKVSVESVNKFFDEKLVKFFKKKKPKSDSYPFQIVDPYTVFGDKGDFLGFYLVGDNWLEGKDKPIVICWGFNDWKMGFVSEYLRDYRVAFAPRKMWRSNAVYQYFKINSKVSSFVVWGMNESSWVRTISKISSIPIWRMEDGFIRSAALGAEHSVPYSLVLDKKGIYYNSNTVSELENILQTYDFSEKPDLLEKAKTCIELMLKLDITKYNPPNDKLSLVSLRPKTRKRVAVIGQVDSDASIKFGNPDGWDSESLIRLATYENPDAEIIYRPHPEIYKGYQKSKFRKKKVEFLATVADPNESLSAFLASIDHIYTITSLSGLEALVRRIPVTTVGVPFYAGWGLTDDRAVIERRSRCLELEELFAIAYIVYPKYLAAEDPFVGFFSSCFKIDADRKIIHHDICENDFNIKYSDEQLNFTRFIKYIFRSDNEIELDYLKEAVSNNVFQELFSEKGNGQLFQTAMVFFLAGRIKNSTVLDFFLESIKNKIDRVVLNDLLLKLTSWRFGFTGNDVFSWMLRECGEFEPSLNIYLSSMEEEADPEKDGFCPLPENYYGPSSAQLKECFGSVQAAVLAGKYDAVIDDISYLLYWGYNVNQVVKLLTTLSELQFDFVSMEKLAVVSQNISLYQSNRNSILYELRAYLNSEKFSEFELMRICTKVAALKPDKIANLITAIDMMDSGCRKTLFNNAIKSIIRLNGENSIRQVKAYLAIDNFSLAEKLCIRIIENGDSSEAARICFSQSLSFNGKVDQAIKLMLLFVYTNPTRSSIEEVIRLGVIANNYNLCMEMLTLARENNIFIGEMYRRKTYFGKRMIRNAFETFTELSVSQCVFKYYPDKYFKFNLDEHIESCLFISIFGPGDEIRFASIYKKVQADMPNVDLKVTCSPRFFELFSRSFEAIDFIPVTRPRNSDKMELSEYKRVPGLDIAGVINDTAVDVIATIDKVAMVTDLLHHYLVDYDSFSGEKYLIPNQHLQLSYSNCLPTATFLVGLSWRSSVTSHSRNEHYLTVEELKPLFEIEGVQFVNLQYDECDEELEWVEKRYPGKLINFSDLDQYNDFEGVAALMSCLDLIISPATTVVELAGALGIPTWLFSNSSEIDWRKKNSENIDVWYSSVEIVDCEPLGNKTKLVACLKNKLDQTKLVGSRYE